MLFTGFADLESIIAAINQGHIYQFMKKPWQPEELLAAVRQAALEYDRLETMAMEREQLVEEVRELKHRVSALEIGGPEAPSGLAEDSVDPDFPHAAVPGGTIVGSAGVTSFAGGRRGAGCTGAAGRPDFESFPRDALQYGGRPDLAAVDSESTGWSEGGILCWSLTMKWTSWRACATSSIARYRVLTCPSAAAGDRAARAERRRGDPLRPADARHVGRRVTAPGPASSSPTRSACSSPAMPTSRR